MYVWICLHSLTYCQSKSSLAHENSKCIKCATICFLFEFEPQDIRKRTIIRHAFVECLTTERSLSDTFSFVRCMFEVVRNKSWKLLVKMELRVSKSPNSLSSIWDLLIRQHNKNTTTLTKVDKSNVDQINRNHHTTPRKICFHGREINTIAAISREGGPVGVCVEKP